VADARNFSSSPRRTPITPPKGKFARIFGAPHLRASFRTSKAFRETSHRGCGDADSCLCDQPAKGKSFGPSRTGAFSAAQDDRWDCCNERRPKEHWSHLLRKRQPQTAATVPGRHVQDLLGHREAKVIVHFRCY